MNVKIVNNSIYSLPSNEIFASAGTDLRTFLDEPVLLKRLESSLIPTAIYNKQPPMDCEARVRPRSRLTMKKDICGMEHLKKGQGGFRHTGS
jgi:dUTP pyrophosphatase